MADDFPRTVVPIWSLFRDQVSIGMTCGHTGQYNASLLKAWPVNDEMSDPIQVSNRGIYSSIGTLREIVRYQFFTLCSEFFARLGHAIPNKFQTKN